MITYAFGLIFHYTVSGYVRGNAADAREGARLQRARVVAAEHAVPRAPGAEKGNRAALAADGGEGARARPKKRTKYV